MLFKEKLVILRKSRGLTQDEFASAVGVSRQAVYKWECGQSYPEVPKLLEMKLLLGISIDDLLDDSFDIPIPQKKKRKRISKEQKAEIEASVAKEQGVAAPAPKAEPAKKEEPKAEPVKVEAAPAAAPAPKAEPAKKEEPKAEPVKVAAAPAAAPAPKAEETKEPIKAVPDAAAVAANANAQASLDDAASALEKLEKQRSSFLSRFFGKKK